MITKARITQTTVKGSEIRARSIGMTTEMVAPRYGMKEIKPLKMPMSNAKGTPIIESEMAQKTAMNVMAVSWPRNHRCTVWYIAWSTSRVLGRHPAGKSETNL